jgi:transcriptional regulator
LVNHKRVAIEERRRRVVSLRARSLTEEEIAREVGCDQTTVSKDIQASIRTKIFDTIVLLLTMYLVREFFYLICELSWLF